VNGLRSYFVEAGLHFFKHRKRVLYVSSTKPVRHPAGQVFSDGITAILKTIEATPRIKRPDLAAKILGEQHDAPESAARKEQLASDLHYLIHAGHVIEFSNGMLELPLAPQDKAPQERGPKPASSGSAAAGADQSTVTEAGEPASEVVTESEPEPSSEAHSAATSQSADAAEALHTAPETIESNEPPPESISTAQAPSPAEEPADSSATP
jgi:hypothetical protein